MQIYIFGIKLHINIVLQSVFLFDENKSLPEVYC